MPTIHDVAKRANVSIATVSRVTSGLNVVDAETKRKVLDAMKELNYVPNGMARNLRLHRSNIILAILTDIKNSFFSEFIKGLEETARASGYQLLLASTDGNQEIEKQYLSLLDEKKVDGIILSSARLDLKLVEEACKRKPIVVAFDYMAGNQIPSVSIDNVAAARKITKHLLSKGHRRIAFISGPSIRLNVQSRLAGYKQALHEFGLLHEESLIQTGDVSLEAGFKMASHLMDIEKRPTAIFAASDELAIGAIHAVTARGLKVPEDIAIVGFDDIQISSFIRPTLTTIHQPRYDIGKLSMELLIQRIKKQKPAQNHIILQDELIVRDSCGMSKQSIAD